MLCLYKLLFLQIFLYLLYYSTFGKTQNFRKVFAEALDRFGFVLCGTAGTENRLDYDHITLPDLGVDGLCSSNFRLLEFVEKEFCEKSKSKFFAAANKKFYVNKNFNKQRRLIVSDF